MLTQGFGELLTDILTVNPAIKSIATASSILDTSNYTFNAVTLGKDAQGFLQHGHSLFAQAGDLNTAITLSNLAAIDPVTFGALAIAAWKNYVTFNNEFVTTLRFNTFSPSSYFVSSTHIQLSGGPQPYFSIPNYPSIYDNRLERESTKTSFDSYTGKVSFDLGHYMNPAVSLDDVSDLESGLSSLYGVSAATVSSLWNIIGYPPSGNVGKFRLLSSITAFTTPATSGSLSGVFNSQRVMDKGGFIKINEALNVTSLSSGPYVISSTNFLTVPGVTVGVGIQRGDAVALALLGGVNHIGVWCLDLKEMLKSGLNPPYSWNYLNNTRKYKLVAKVTFWDNILYHEDVSTNSGLSLLDTNGVLVKLNFNFK